MKNRRYIRRARRRLLVLFERLVEQDEKGAEEGQSLKENGEHQFKDGS